MERNGMPMISPHYSAQEYINLGLCEDSDEDTWNKAIEMVKDRFYSRFFSVIRYLSTDWRTRQYNKEKAERNGFAIMALNCLLIDAFYQFEAGVKDTKGVNQKTYTAFLNNHFSNMFCSEPAGQNTLASLFYDRIRNGILHSAETKGYSMLSCEGGAPISYINKGTPSEGIRVELGMFSDALKNFFYDYIRELQNNNITLRSNFIKKMNFICNVDPPEF